MNDPSAWVSKAEALPCSPKKPKTIPADCAAAALLRKFARSQGWVVLASESNWAQPVAILRRALLKSEEGKADPDLLEKVLKWYVGWYAPGKRPTIRNGKEFKERWNWLHQLYLRETNQAAAGVSCPRKSNPEHPEVKELLAELTYYEWPRGSADQLPAIVTQSHANYSSFFERLSTATLDRTGRLFRECVVAEFGPPRDFVEAWFKDVLRRVSDWGDWSGDLSYFLWRPDHKDFIRRARGVILQAGADRDECDAFFRLLNPGRAIAGA